MTAVHDFALKIEQAPPAFVRVTDLHGVKHWLPVEGIERMRSTTRGTEIRFYDGETLAVREQGDDILLNVKRATYVELVKIIR